MDIGNSTRSMEPGLFEEIISNLLSTVSETWLVDRSPRTFDFVVDKGDEFRVAIEARVAMPSQHILHRLRQAVQAAEARISEFILVSPTLPPASALRDFGKIFAGASVPAKWVGINELPGMLGLEVQGNLLDPETGRRLQLRALVKNLDFYTRAPIGAPPASNEGSAETIARDPNVESLSRQFPLKVIKSLYDQKGAITDQLNFGKRISDVTVVLSDLKNFSLLVAASTPDELNEMMARYYIQARDAVFRHGGMLDKFIGDAVLAIFGYPVPTERSGLDALLFARELVAIGDSILKEWGKEINAVIETGTRVGVSTGDIWPLNIGTSSIEVTLLGHSINLAARLEKNCQVNGLLLDNRTYNKARSTDSQYVESLGAAPATIGQEEAKGQQFATQAWRVPPYSAS